MRSTRVLFLTTLLLGGLLLAACGDDNTESGADTTTTTVSDADADADADEAVTDDDTAPDSTTTTTTAAAAEPSTTGETVTLTAEVWADNWFSLWVNGELIGEDSVPITTERSFNAETFTFEATYPLTIAIEAKDFKETDSGIEYIGQPNQQMGDGGIIAQFTDTTSGEIVAVTSSGWSALVVHQAPLNTDCVGDADPDATCEFSITETPTEWTSVDFDDSAWAVATTWSEADVSPKDGYDEISWDGSAELIWGTDLEVDNTVLLRQTVG